METIFKQCGDCGSPFMVTCDTDWICDTCADKIFPHSHHMSEKELHGRNWEDRKIKQQWKKSYQESQDRLLNKCKGVNYHN